MSKNPASWEAGTKSLEGRNANLQGKSNHCRGAVQCKLQAIDNVVGGENL
jgi:hypothetical protein